MDWLNIHRSTLAAKQFLGCEPTQRATWLCLLTYCADQENGGCIEGASEWDDRKWQQIVRITHSEAHDKCDLWRWEDGVLIVWAYPVEKEAEVRRNRENGKGGGRPPKPKENQVVSSGLTGTEPPAPISAETERKGKGIGKEGKKKENFSAEAEAIYLAYPKKVAPDKAKAAIEKALKRVEFPVLLEAVQAYAKAKDGQDPTYTKQPQGWFNDSRWLDDRATWEPKQQSSKPAPKLNGFTEGYYEKGRMVKDDGSF